MNRPASFALLFLLGALLFACGSEKDGEDDGFILPGENSVLGQWEIFDINADTVPWYTAQGGSLLYLQSESGQLTWRFVKEGGNACYVFPVTRQSVSRFVVSEDAEACWFELTTNGGLQMQLNAKHRDDPQGKTYTFYFKHIDYLPATAGGDCVTLTTCPRFFEAAPLSAAR